MRQYGFMYSNLEDMKFFIFNNNIKNEENILIQVFTGVIKTEFIENIIWEILSILPQAEIIGTTTAGEILREKAIFNETVISITIFERTKIKSKLLNCDNNEYEVGVSVAKELIEEDTKVLILFSEALLTNSFDIIKGIQAVNSNVPICGGKAGDNRNINETFVFTNQGIIKKGAAVVSLTGKQLNITTDYSLGWSTIGKLMTITKASNNRVYTIDNVKTIDIYRKYLGEDVAKGLPLSAVTFPLILVEDGLKIAKVPCACNEDGSLTFLSDIKVNDKVRFGYSNVNMLIGNSLEICDRLTKKNIEALFVYSCSVRRHFMQEKINLEVGPLNRIAPTFGFFTYGEFFSFNNSNKILNVAMTILGMSEGEQVSYDDDNLLDNNKKVDNNFFEVEDLIVTKAFTKLVDETTKELKQANDVLEEQKNKLRKMNNITKSILQINSEIIHSGEFDSFIQMMLDKILDVITKGKMGSILLVKNDKLKYKATRGYDLEKVKNVTYGIEKLYKCNVIDGDSLFNPVIVKDTKKMIFFDVVKYEDWSNLLNEQPKEILTCCIGIDGKAVGIVTLFNTDKEEDFNEEDKSILKYICYDVAIALKNFNLLDSVLYMSRYDSLTGTHNRGYFREVLTGILNESNILKTPFVICGLDLNDFKIINDTYGHDKGDEVLIKFVSIFKSEIDKEDILGRIGGDEFVAVFVNKTREEVALIMDRIYEKIMNYNFEFDGHINNVGFAYGLAEFSRDSDDIDELLRIADKRMYGKKRIMKD